MGTNLPVEIRNLSTKQKLLYGVGLTSLSALAAPVAILALTTVTSLLTAFVMGLLLFGGFLALPLILRWWRIKVFALMKKTARDNPVETLQLELIARKRAFESAGSKIVVISAQRDSLRDRLKDYEKKYGQQDADLGRAADQLSKLVDRLRISLRQTGITLDEFERFVERQAERSQLAEETGKLAVLLKGTTGGDVTARFLQGEAIQSIRNALNLSFAEIDDILTREEVKNISQSNE